MLKVGDNITVQIIRTNFTEIPCIWEAGNKKETQGFSQIIASSNGNRKKALYISKFNKSKKHALIPIAISDFIIKTSINNGNVFTTISQVKDLNLSKLGSTAICNIIAIKYNDQWQGIMPNYLNIALEMSIAKANHEDCKKVYYIKNE